MPRFQKQVKGGASVVFPNDSTSIEESNENEQNQPEKIDTIEVDYMKLQEEEESKKKEQHLKQRIVDLKEQEERYTKYNLLKIKDVWLKLLRKAKVDELKKQIEVLSQTHDRQVERKDAVVQILFRDLMEAEEQEKLALRSHLQHLDELMDLQKKNVDSLEDDFEKELVLLEAEFETEKKRLIERFQEEEREMIDITEEMEKRSQKMNEKLEKEFLHNKEAIRTKYQEKYNVMQMLLKEKIKSLQEKTKLENLKHCDAMDAKYKDYIVLRENDDDLTDQIKKQTIKIKMFEESLANWKTKWLNNIRESEERNKKLVEEKNQLNHHFKELKKRMEKFRNGENKRLKELIQMSRETMKKLKEKIEKGNRLIKLFELNRKIETEREKFMPFEGNSNGQSSEFEDDSLLYGNGIHNDEENLSSANQFQQSVIASLKQEGGANEWEQLGKFYRKYNKVLLDKVALQQEKKHLIDENQQLRQMLKNYLDGISVNEDVLNKKNPLLIIDNIQRQPRYRMNRRNSVQGEMILENSSNNQEVIVESSTNNNMMNRERVLN